MSNTTGRPSPPRKIRLARFDEKSSGRATASLTSAALETTYVAVPGTSHTGAFARSTAYSADGSSSTSGRNSSVGSDRS